MKNNCGNSRNFRNLHARFCTPPPDDKRHRRRRTPGDNDADDDDDRRCVGPLCTGATNFKNAFRSLWARGLWHKNRRIETERTISTKNYRTDTSTTPKTRTTNTTNKHKSTLPGPLHAHKSFLGNIDFRKRCSLGDDELFKHKRPTII